MQQRRNLHMGTTTMHVSALVQVTCCCCIPFRHAPMDAAAAAAGGGGGSSICGNVGCM